ncbi:hypothetical protein Tco_0941878 [Tanacetum coccineum]|uniref:Uncharacterized protein n=1 Tax=Tanacetum coccineum TaxID=301880 RepID=A0ABQ5DUU8_9ASTR
MTRSTIKKLTEPLEEPEREFHRRTKVACRQQQNESLAIAERNLFDDEASSSANTEPKPLSSSKSVREHSSPNSDGFQNPIVLHVEQTGNIVESRDIWLIQGDMILRFQQGTNEPIKDTWIRFQDLIWQVPHHGIQKWLLVQIFHDNISPEDRGKLDQYAHFRFSSLNEEEGWNCIEEYVQYQDDLWDDPPPPMYVSSISKLICDICGGVHEADECDSNKPREQVCLSRGDIYDDPSLLRFYQNYNIPPWGNGLGEMLNQQRNKMHNQFSQILETLEDRRTLAPKPDASTFAITTRSGTTTHDPSYPILLNSTNVDDTERGIENDKPEGEETTTTKSKETPHSPILYHPSKSSSVPFPSRLKKQKKDDDDEQLLSIFRQIYVNLPFLKAMIHMPKGA